MPYRPDVVPLARAPVVVRHQAEGLGRGAHGSPPARLSAHRCAARRVGSGAGDRSVTSGLSTVAVQPLPSATRVTVSTRPPLYARHTARSDARAHGSSAGCWPASCLPGACLPRRAHHAPPVRSSNQRSRPSAPEASASWRRSPGPGRGRAAPLRRGRFALVDDVDADRPAAGADADCDLAAGKSRGGVQDRVGDQFAGHQRGVGRGRRDGEEPCDPRPGRADSLGQPRERGCRWPEAAGGRGRSSRTRPAFMASASWTSADPGLARRCRSFAVTPRARKTRAASSIRRGEAAGGTRRERRTGR